MNAVAAEAEKKGVKHHPEWTNVYNQVQIRWTTHRPLGLSEKDLTMAHFCDAAAADFGALEAVGNLDQCDCAISKH